MACIRLWNLQQSTRSLQPYLSSVFGSRLYSGSSTTGSPPAPPDNASTTATGTAPTEKKKIAGPPELNEKKWQLAFHQKEKGRIAGKLPVKISLKKGKMYSWCTCGYSHHQPLCDNTHRIPQLRLTLKPMIFKAPADMDVWLCTCKQSNNRPFCDGAHRAQEVQEAIKD